MRFRFARMEDRMTISPRTLALASALSVCAAPSLGAQDAVSAEDPLLRVQAQGDALEEFGRKADELSETARRTIEDFIALVGPMLTQFSRLIDGLPTYETPEILPNGDIIIRRKLEAPAPVDEADDGLTET